MNGMINKIKNKKQTYFKEKKERKLAALAEDMNVIDAAGDDVYLGLEMEHCDKEEE